jgi:two-component system chemotaxis sensor kinase CheA
MDMSQYLGAFLDEAGDNLKHLDDLILLVENDPSNPDAINEIFRSAHTLKGMSATMGFEKMASLTHAIEDMLDGVRKGEYSLRGEDIDLLFRSLDTMQSMVDSIRGGGNDASVETEALVASIRASVKADRSVETAKTTKEEPLSGQDEEWIREARGLGMNVYEVRVVLSPSCLLKTARAYMVVSRLEELGDLIKTIPPVEALENEQFSQEFTVYVSTGSGSEQIEATLSRVSELAAVEVRELGVAQVPEPKAEPSAQEADSVTVEEEIIPPSEAEPSADRTPEMSPEKRIGTLPKADAQAPKKAADASKKASQTVRVDIGRLDKLMNLVGELVIGKARIERLVQESRLREFDEPLSQLGRISGDIQELVTKLRMVPVSFIFERFPRLVRDLSKTLKKEVALVLEGQETELDRTVIDEIGEPMVHLIRNCLDHGIEVPEERVRAGKAEKGTITISAYQEGSGVIIQVSDDGHGIDVAKVKEKALRKGVVTQEQADAMTEDELIHLIYLPGFSLAEKVTDISGRGVGMDAVKTKVEALGGQFEVHTKLGEGTSVFVRLPLTLAIVVALLIKVGDEIYAIPLESVEETILVKRENVKTVHGTPATLLRGDVLALSDLASILGTATPERDDAEYPVVVVKAGKNKIGFIVDELIGQQEIVIKSLGRFLSKIKGIAGATILGDGNVALILDVSSLYAR